MEAGIKGTKAMACEMERVNSTIKKEASMMGSGRITICTGMANYIILIKSSHMKENGLLTNFMVEVKSIMMSPPPFSAFLITLTLTI